MKIPPKKEFIFDVTNPDGSLKQFSEYGDAWDDRDMMDVKWQAWWKQVSKILIEKYNSELITPMTLPEDVRATSINILVGNDRYCSLRDIIRYYIQENGSNENCEDLVNEAMSDVSLSGVDYAIEILETMLRIEFREWKPTEGYGSEEEMGYQKGIVAQNNLARKQVMDKIVELNKERP